MLMRKPLLWIAASAVVCAAILLRGEEDEPAEHGPGPDLFSFVRALPVDTTEPLVRNSDRQDSALQSPAPEPAAVPATNAVQIEEAVRRMRAQGASDDEVYRARAAALGAETAATLARRDSEETLWQQRVSAYLSQRTAIAADPVMLQALKDRLFTLEEQTLLSAYEPAPMPLTGMPQ